MNVGDKFGDRVVIAVAGARAKTRCRGVYLRPHPDVCNHEQWVAKADLYRGKADRCLECARRKRMPTDI